MIIAIDERSVLGTARNCWEQYIQNIGELMCSKAERGAQKDDATAKAAGSGEK